MISVIIPTHNRSDFLLQAVDSVLKQKQASQPVELIVVDDGSTEDICSALSSAPGEIGFLRQEHSGVSAARNLGILAARGEWLAFLDSDDLWLPAKLAAQEQFFRENPDMLLCQTEEIWLRNGRRLNPRKYHRKPEGYCFDLLLERCLVSPSAVMMHRRLLDRVGLFDESLPACEDYDLWLRIGCRFPLGLVPEQLVAKRGGHPDQLSATVQALDRYRIQSMINLLRSGLLNAEQTTAAKRVLFAKSAVYIKGCRKRGNSEEAENVAAALLAFR
ncbi:MAG: glycosyltransferase [Desulfobacteraceae bacterium]|nr:glycosyltransferase [Desulfobacteraceae bacterium]